MRTFYLFFENRHLQNRSWVRYLLVLLCIHLFINFDAHSEAISVVDAKVSPDTIDNQVFDSTKGAWWYSQIARDAYEKKDYENAIQHFTHAIAIDPEVSEFYYFRGNAFTYTNQSLKALSDYKKALELDPDYLSVLNNQSWEYIKQGEYSKGFGHFIAYFKMIPKDFKSFLNVGLSKDYLKILNNLGWESVRKNELPKAIRYFNSYLELAPNDPDAYLGLAVIYNNYHDIAHATWYLNRAKEFEPALYQGITGLASLEKSGCTYSDQDKESIGKMYADITDKLADIQKITKLGTWNYLVAFMYIFLGIMAIFIFTFRIKRFEGFIFYLGLLNITFGLKFLSNNPLIQFSELSSANFWIYGMPIVALIFPVAFILFIRYFIGWGWKRSIFWLLIYSILQGLIRIISEYSHPAHDIYGTTNTIFGYLAIIVLFLHLFLPEMRKNREVQIISFGLGLYLIAIFYDNLEVVPFHITLNNPAYMVFNICLIYVAFRRITNTEKAYLAVQQDLETARNIQNAILPENNPKGKGFEVSSAYLPMALIGGDYYDYQLGNDSHIGLLIADVSGHGISAALIASMLKIAFVSQINNARNPSVVLQQINQSLNGQLNNEFITAGYMGIDLTNKELTYSSAGHPPMLVYRRNKNEINEIKVGGIPIGINPETKYSETKMQLLAGDRLILYTDGVTDVFNLSGEAMGKTRFIELIKGTKNLMAEDTVDSILASINEWSGKKELESHDDDITLIVFDIV